MKKIINKIKYLCVFIAAVMLIAPATAQQLLREGAPEMPRRVQPSLADVAVKNLPPEARETLTLIEKGGPYPFDRDGIVFGNFEKRLPIKDRGYYNEFTVKTPGIKHRGARRIVTGKGGDKYYSDDHYKTFKRIVP
ncbi:MAG TPA: ribonuclease domain-containing protein [Burkholderiales bacterium]|nr:ribonuclease domain-containing protein [Burkholderiales bacterium]